MVMLNRLLMVQPGEKKVVGTELAPYLIHQGLFETPHGTAHGENPAPKCKNFSTRKAAFDLLATLCRDSLESLTMVLSYLKNFNMNPTWRTNRENDWKVKFFDEEKSSTGYVGIKNLGCICYMNSVN